MVPHSILVHCLSDAHKPSLIDLPNSQFNGAIAGVKVDLSLCIFTNGVCPAVLLVVWWHTAEGKVYEGFLYGFLGDVFLGVKLTSLEVGDTAVFCILERGRVRNKISKIY